MLMDDDTGNMENANATIVDSNITISSEQLPKNRHYNVILRAANINGIATSYTTISEWVWWIAH